MITILFLALALFGFLHQGIVCHSWWDWGQVWHHEVLIISCLCVALGSALRRAKRKWQHHQ